MCKSGSSPWSITKHCIQEINSLCSAFLWSGPVFSTQKAKISWADVCKQKEEGGLGLRYLEEVNRFSCLKLIWCILSSRSFLWVQWIQRYLIRKGSFWSVKETNSLGYWMWKKLLKLWPMAMQLTNWKLIMARWRCSVLMSGLSWVFWST